jgi:MFS-type transporter involved in bile tolerance (Atg22 family)
VHNRDFYIVAAEVLPLLFITLIFQFRFVDPQAYSRGGYVLTKLVVLAAIGLGETVALRVLFNETSSRAEDVIVAVGLAIGGWMVWFTPVITILTVAETQHPRLKPLIALVEIGLNLGFLAALVYGILYGI